MVLGPLLPNHLFLDSSGSDPNNNVTNGSRELNRIDDEDSDNSSMPSLADLWRADDGVSQYHDWYTSLFTYPNRGDYIPKGSKTFLSSEASRFCFRRKLYKDRHIRGIEFPEQGPFKKPFQILPGAGKIDFIVNYRCDYYIRKGVVHECPNGPAQLLIQDTTSSLVSNADALYTLQCEIFNRVVNSNWVLAYKDAKDLLGAAHFEMVYRDVLRRKVWTAVDLENPGNNSHAADWERVGGRDRSVLWVTLTLTRD